MLHNHCFVFWQRIFTDFITVEMLFHAKALEVYTHTYDNLETLNTQKDLEVQPMPMIQLITPETKIYQNR